MSASALLIPELEQVIQSGSPERRATTLTRIANLFADGASAFSDEHVGLFDDVLCRLMGETGTPAREELSRTLAPVANAPAKLMRELAHDPDISVAGPVLTRSARLREADLLEIAGAKSQAHLLAIACREGLSEAVTGVLVSSGDPHVARNLAGNRTACLSEASFAALVQRAEDDAELAETVGARPDLPAHLFRELLLRSGPELQQRLIAAAKQDTEAAVQRALDTASRSGRSIPSRDYSAAQRAVLELFEAGKLDEPTLAAFASDMKFEETVAALSALCSVPIETVDRLMSGDRPDPVLILCKAAEYGWPTACAIIQARPHSKGPSGQALNEIKDNFEKLSTSTAQRVVRFWQVRQPEN